MAYGYSGRIFDYPWRLDVVQAVYVMPDDHDGDLVAVREALSEDLGPERLEWRVTSLRVYAATEAEATQIERTIADVIREDDLWLVVGIEHQNPATATWEGVEPIPDTEPAEFALSSSGEFAADRLLGTGRVENDAIEFGGASGWYEALAHVVLHLESRADAEAFARWLGDYHVPAEARRTRIARTGVRSCNRTLATVKDPGNLGGLRTAPGLVEPRFLAQAAGLMVLSNSYSIGVSMPRLEWRRRRL